MTSKKILPLVLIAIGCGAQPLLADLSDCGDNLLPANPQSSASYDCAAIATGNWNSSTTWKNGVVPTTLANPTVLIPANITVTIGNPYTNNAISNLVVFGSLKFIHSGQMRVSTLLIRPGGLLQMGTDAAPIGTGYLAQITIPDVGPVNTNWDTTAVSHGILNEGTVVICGEEKAAFVALTSDAAADDTVLHLASAPTGWQVGDSIVLASTDFTTSWTANFPKLHNEVRTITAISGNDVTIDSGLVYDHTRAEAGFQIHVANLTRNVVIQSESLNIGHRGHFMTCTNDAVIRNALFLRMGRTDKRAVVTDPGLTANGFNNPRARYSLHFHECGTALSLSPGVVTGCVAQDTPGWAFVNHASYVNFTNNVAFDFDGNGFSTEDGDEAGSFVNNMAIGGTGNGEFPERRIIFGDQSRQDAGDTGFNGEGFWFQSPDITVTGNVAAGCKGTGYVWWCGGRYSPELGHFTGFPRARIPAGVVPRYWTYDTNRIIVTDIPIKKCDNNVAYGCFAGMKLRWVNNGNRTFFNTTLGGFSGEIHAAPGYTDISDATRKPYTISNCTFWNVENGLHATYSSLVTFSNIAVVCVSTNGSLGGVGASLPQNADQQTYVNLRVKNFLTGMAYDVATPPTETGTTMTGVSQPYFAAGDGTNNVPNYQMGTVDKNQDCCNNH